MLVTCKVCGGTYETVQGNTRYFHACAPVVDAVTVKRGTTLETVKADAVLPTDDVQAVTYVERPNKVDENVKPIAKG
jgi:ssDNA-binding Zn-finger/Zn-ribbon topoisomerase 1